jgi:hypothetical protein
MEFMRKDKREKFMMERVVDGGIMNGELDIWGIIRERGGET